MKRLLALLLAVVLPAVFLFCNTASCEEIIFDTGRYRILGDGTAEIAISWFSGEEDLVIPDNIDGIPVTSLGKKSISSTAAVTVTVPEGIVHIETGAFDHIFSMTTITIPDSVRSIEGNPFDVCNNLTTIIVSEDHPYLEVVDGVLFSKPDHRLICCPAGLGKEEYVIPEGTEIIAREAFNVCRLCQITIPDSVHTIGCGAFHSCYFSSFTIPDSVTTIEGNPFIYNSRLGSILISPDHPTLAIENGMLYNKAENLLIWCPDFLAGEPGTGEFEIPDFIRSIGAWAFYGDKQLERITIPAGVTSIGERAFFNCKMLTQVELPDSLTSIGEYAFEGCGELREVTIPEGVEEIGEGTFYGCGKITRITLPNSLKSIGDHAFGLCENLTAINLPEGLTRIGMSAFYRCKALREITIPKSVTALGLGVFSECSSSLTVWVYKGSYASKSLGRLEVLSVKMITE